VEVAPVGEEMSDYGSLLNYLINLSVVLLLVEPRFYGCIHYSSGPSWIF